jgi:hypothetical protein
MCSDSDFGRVDHVFAVLLRLRPFFVPRPFVRPDCARFAIHPLLAR